jgi:hypothetical protein
MKCLLLTATLLCLLLHHPAQAQTAEDQAAQKAWMEYMTPGPFHQMLAKSDGEWNYSMSAWMKPDAEPVKSTGTSVNRMILGGRYQESRSTGTFMDQPFEGIGTTGYDNAKKMVVSSWVDNMGTGVMYLEGKWDEATKTVTLNGKMLDPMTGKDCPVKEVIKWVDDNTQKMEMYTTVDGKEFKSMELTMTRK